MSHYSDNPSHCRVDIFKDTGKWYTTITVDWKTWHLKEEYNLPQLLREYVRDQHEGRFEGMLAVCLEPYHECSHPIMVKLGDT